MLGDSSLESVAITVSEVGEVGDKFFVVSLVLGISGTGFLAVVFSLIGVVLGWNGSLTDGIFVGLGLTSSLATVSGLVVGTVNIFLDREFLVGVT